MKKTKYYLDTEFLEGTQKTYQWGLKTDTWLRIFGAIILLTGMFLDYSFHLGYWFSIPSSLVAGFIFSLSIPKTPNTIDLISIGIVSENGREYYAISKDFNLKEAWNRYDLVKKHRFQTDYSDYEEKVYWIRENVLRPIFNDLQEKSLKDIKFRKNHFYSVGNSFSYNRLKDLIEFYGHSNEQIATQISIFTLDPTGNGYKEWLGSSDNYLEAIQSDSIESPVFYAYYGSYDWVVFCWLFGKMITLPKRFPKYCIDLKQMQDYYEYKMNVKPTSPEINFKKHSIKKESGYPKKENQHDALSDAKWNKKLYDFLEGGIENKF